MIERRNVDATGALLALLTSVFWGANTVAIKLGLADAPPLRLAWMRFVVGGVAIAVWAWATGRLAGLRIARDEWRPMLMLALIFTAQIGSMNIGTSLTSAALASILLNLYSVHTVVLSHFLIPGDRLTLRRVAGVAIAYTGIVVLFAGQMGGGSASLLGDAIVFVSAFLLAERLVYLARAVQQLDPVKLLLYEWNQSIEGGRVPLTPFQKKCGDLRAVVRNVAILCRFSAEHRFAAAFPLYRQEVLCICIVNSQP